MLKSGFEVTSFSGAFSFEVIGRPAPDAADFVERNLVEVRLSISRHHTQPQIVEGAVYVGDMVRFANDLELLADGRWHPNPSLEKGDPLRKRDALRLPLTGGCLGIAYKERFGGFPHYELTYTPPGGETVQSELRLKGKQLQELARGIGGLFPHFGVVASPVVAPELSADVQQWMLDFATDMVDDRYFLRLDALRRHGWGAVLCKKHWLEQDVVRTQQLLNAIGTLIDDEILVYAFIEVPEAPQFARIPRNLDAFIGYLTEEPYRPIDNILFTSQGGHFAILVTHEDHMVVAGPAPFIHQAFSGFKSEVRSQFRHDLFCRKSEYPEAWNEALIESQDRWLQWDLQYAALLSN